jgi:hypothetical protein
MAACELVLLGVHACLQPPALTGVEPFCLCRPVRQEEQHHRRQHHGWRRLDDEQPLPAGETKRSIHAQDQTRERRPDDRRERDGDHEIAGNASAILSGEPE